MSSLVSWHAVAVSAKLPPACYFSESKFEGKFCLLTNGIDIPKSVYTNACRHAVIPSAAEASADHIHCCELVELQTRCQ